MRNILLAIATLTVLGGGALAQPFSALPGPGPVPCGLTTCTVQNLSVTASTAPTNGMALPGANTIGFYTNSTLRASINSSGTFIASAANSWGINGTAASCTAPTFTPNKAGATYGWSADATPTKLCGTVNGVDIFDLLSTGPAVLVIPADTASTDATVCRDTTSGALKTGTGALGICLGTSTMRFKRNITPMASSLAGVALLKLVNFRYRPGHGYDAEKYQNGLLVEDVAKVFPDCTGLGPDKKPLNLDAFCIVFHALKAQQEQQAEIVALQAAMVSLRHSH